MFTKIFAKLAKWSIAFVFIGFGVVLILQNLNIISLEMSNVVWNSWPVILVIFGLIFFSNYFIPSKSGSWKFGSFLIVFGALLWAGNFDYIEFGFIDVWKLWPLILIYIGANILFGRKSVSITIENDEKEEEHNHEKDSDVDQDHNYDWKKQKKHKKSGRYKYHVTSKKHLVRDINFSKENWEVKNMDLWTGVGNLYFDFSKGYIPNQETKIRLKGYIADIQMKLPENVAYRIYANVNIGDVTIFEQNRSGMGSSISYESDDYKTATKKVDIYMDYKIGDITVLSV